MHPFLVLFALAVGAVFGAGPVGLQRADTCSCGDTALAELVESADAVFVGTPIGVNSTVEGPAGPEDLWDFQVEAVYAGPKAEVVAISGGGELSNCSVEFAPGLGVGIVARWRSGHLATGQCCVVDANEMVAALGEGRPPLVSSRRTGTTPGIVALGVAAAAAGLAIGWRLVRSRRTAS